MLALRILLFIGVFAVTGSHAFETKLASSKLVANLRRTWQRIEEQSEDAGLTKKEKRRQRLMNHLRAPYSSEAVSFHAKYHDQAPMTVDYGGNHPFERRRKLDEDLVVADYGDRDGQAPIRIRFLTDSFAGQRTTVSDPDILARFDLILDSVLPAAEQAFTEKLFVFPVASALEVAEETCFEVFGLNQALQPYLTTGVDDADMGLLVIAEECEPGQLASALACARDQFDRPVLGLVFMCLNVDIDPTDTDDVDDLTVVVIHEITHALGFNSNLYPYYRNATTGEPLTPRTDTGTVAPRTVPCVNGTDQMIPFAAENTIKAFTTTPGVSGNELLHYEIVTPRVQSVVRNHINCQSLEGARLENRPTNMFDCTGSHWDERFFNTEIMSALADKQGDQQGVVFSPLTLALLEDTGWYTATYENTELPGYGQNRGCEFLTGDCIVDNNVPEYGEGIFCSEPFGLVDLGANSFYCDPTHTAFAFCALFEQSALPNPPENPILYFSDPNLVAPSQQHDFCPILTPLSVLGGTGIDCTDEGTIGLDLYVGETYGANSRCVNVATTGFLPRPACLSIECDEDNSQVIVGGRVCEFDGQMHGIFSADATFPDGMFECPPLSLICPELAGCPADCSGRGTCNYDVIPPQCECFDPASSSEICAGPTPATLPPEPPTPVTPRPTFAPSIANPCQEELDAVISCLSIAATSCGGCLDAASQEIFDSGSVTCASFQEDMCLAIDTLCDCDPCRDEAELFYACIVFDGSSGDCDSFDCPLTTQPPIPSPSEPPAGSVPTAPPDTPQPVPAPPTTLTGTSVGNCMSTTLSIGTIVMPLVLLLV